MQFSDITIEIALVAQSFIFFLVTSEVLRGFFTAKRGALKGNTP
jgi:hypothetical protein